MVKNKVDKIDTLKKRSAKQQECFLLAYQAKLCNISEACQAINISRETYYNWLEKYPTFKKQCETIEESLIDIAESALMGNVRAGNTASIIFFLCNRKNDRWQNVQKIQHTGAGDAPLAFEIHHVKNK